MTTSELAELLKLTPKQRLDLIEALWDSLTAKPDAVPMPDWHREVLDERSAADDPTDGDSWDVVRKRLVRRAGS
ncbi:MAG: addiction module protein [Hyphomicrobium sp.]